LATCVAEIVARVSDKPVKSVCSESTGECGLPQFDAVL